MAAVINTNSFAYIIAQKQGALDLENGRSSYIEQHKITQICINFNEDILALDDMGRVHESTRKLVMRNENIGRVIKVGLGYSHRVVVNEQGRVYVWGGSANGQLGTASSVLINSPALLNDFPENIVDVAAGRHHSIAVGESGAIYGWGDNEFGQLCIGNFDYPILKPAKSDLPYPDLKKVVVSTQGYHTIAILKNGTLIAYGSNNSRQLGLGDTRKRSAWEIIPFFNKSSGRIVEDVSCLEHKSVALTVDGKVYWWGKHTEIMQIHENVICKAVSVVSDSSICCVVQKAGTTEVYQDFKRIFSPSALGMASIRIDAVSCQYEHIFCICTSTKANDFQRKMMRTLIFRDIKVLTGKENANT